MTAEPERFSPQARRRIVSPQNELFLSAASAWEIAIKYSIGKLRLPEPPSEFVPSRLALTRTMPLAIQHSHALRVATLPRHHSDPFDRILIAQAQVEQIPILSADPQFDAYEVRLISA